MNKKFASALLPAIFTCSAIIYSSCSPMDQHIDATPFIGTWNGSTTCNGTTTNESLTFSQGSDSYSFTLPYTAGSGKCKAEKKLPFAVVDNTGRLSTVLTDSCNQEYRFNGSVTISGNILTYQVTYSGAAGSGSCTFTGTK